MLLVLGVDPGATGALALVSREGLVRVHDMPTVKVQVGGGLRTRLNYSELFNLLQLAHVTGAHRAFIERVHSAPRQGVSSVFAFGEMYGAIRMAVTAAGTPQELVEPVTWKRPHKLVGQTKDASRQRACELFPEHSKLFSRKKDDGRADAALIAWYGVRQIATEQGLD